MSFFSVLLALLIEQLKPLPPGNPVHAGLASWTRWTSQNFDAGKESHAWVVWSVSALVPAVLSAVVYLLLARVHVLLALAWNVAVLYLTLGFRQFSHYFTDLRDALERGQEDRARELLAEWRHVDASSLPRTELVRQVIEHSLLAAHRHVFGVFFWFLLVAFLGAGPAGAVLYRMAEFGSRYWAFKSRTIGLPANERLMQVAQRAFRALDFGPSRITAAGFAVVGNFEDAVDCWRRYAGQWPDDNDGVILAAAAGAVGVQLGGSSAAAVSPDRSKTFSAGAPAGAVPADASSTPGAPADVVHLRSIVGLVWRSVVLWMALLALLSIARLVG